MVGGSSSSTHIATASAVAIGLVVAAYLVRRRSQSRPLSYEATEALLHKIMQKRASLPRGQLGSESTR